MLCELCGVYLATRTAYRGHRREDYETKKVCNSCAIECDGSDWLVFPLNWRPVWEDC